MTLPPFFPVISRDPTLGQPRESRAEAKGVMQTRGLVLDLHSVTLFNSPLGREQEIVVNMSRGLEVVLMMKTPGLAAAFLQLHLIL